MIPSIPVAAQGPRPTTRAAEPSSGWELVWHDEFDGPNGSAPDSTKWTCEVGGGGWGNHELEYYTARRENVRMEDGTLVIQAKKEHFTGADGVTREYTSARLRTPSFSDPYGRFEARVKVPAGQGLWPAFWMLGNDLGTNGWPACGEIDVMENVGKEPSIVHGTVHGPGYSGGEGVTSSFTLPEGKRFSDDYHVFGVEWRPGSVKFYVDGKPYHTVTPDSLPQGRRWVFDHPFFGLLNVAVGGDWPGAPDQTTSFPQEMRVDWVRMYRATPSGPEPAK